MTAAKINSEKDRGIEPIEIKGEKDDCGPAFMYRTVGRMGSEVQQTASNGVAERIVVPV